MTAKRALLIGHGVVSVPVVILILVGIAPFIEVASFTGRGLVTAWLWWSVVVPRWRLWAIARVSDVPRAELYRRAVATGLLWRGGHLLERTELRGAGYRLSLARAELLGSLHRVDAALRSGLLDAWDGSALEELHRHVQHALSAVQGSTLTTPASRAALSSLGAQAEHHLRMAVLPQEATLDRTIRDMLADVRSALSSGHNIIKEAA
jgi:hypothetical protein